MENKKNFKITFEENSKRCREILARQTPTTYKEALLQVGRLKKIKDWQPLQKAKPKT